MPQAATNARWNPFFAQDGSSMVTHCSIGNSRAVLYPDWDRTMAVLVLAVYLFVAVQRRLPNGRIRRNTTPPTGCAPYCALSVCGVA